jgi:flagellar biosynthetic protein FliO
MRGRGRYRSALLTAALLLGALPAGSASADGPKTQSAADARAVKRPADPSGRPVRGRATSAQEKRPVPKNGSKGGDWLRTAAALALVVGLIFVARYVLRRLSPAGKTAARGEAIEVLTRASLGTRQQLALVRVGRRLVLVGSSPSGMSPLAELSDPDEVAELVEELRSGGRGGGFAAILKRHADRRGGEPASGETGSPRAGGAVRGIADKLRSRFTEGADE